MACSLAVLPDADQTLMTDASKGPSGTSGVSEPYVTTTSSMSLPSLTTSTDTVASFRPRSGRPEQKRTGCGCLPCRAFGLVPHSAG
ncbi:hypothetical protein GA0115253_109027 [Streptomyces sp. Termitarium-T10T-6]|nr:hypothetical protein GA0115253_109027 [Streptomyces sp. Termitarium-T10T-6]